MTLPRFGKQVLSAVSFMILSTAAGASVPTKLMPASGAVHGWKRVGALRTYSGDSLYSFMDGEADAVKAYAFQQLLDGRYSATGRDDGSIDINILDMSDSLNAFGLFSQDRLAGKPLAIGAGGTRNSEGTFVSCWKGRYLVRLASTTRSGATTAMMVAFARAIVSKIPGSSQPPALLRSLPPGRIPRTEGYKRSNVAAHAFVKNAVTARYAALGGFGELFIAEYPNAGAARAAYNQYLSFERYNRGLKSLPRVGQAAFEVLDRYARNVVVALKGRHLIGAHHGLTMRAAESLVKQAVSHTSG